MPYWHPLVKEVMLVCIPVLRPHCHSDHIMKGGTTKAGTHRYKCQYAESLHSSFQLDLSYKGHSPEITEHIVDMALNGSSIRDTARVLKIRSQPGRSHLVDEQPVFHLPRRR